MTPQQRFDIVVYRMDSAKRLLVEIELISIMAIIIQL